MSISQTWYIFKLEIPNKVFGDLKVQWQLNIPKEQYGRRGVLKTSYFTDLGCVSTGVGHGLVEQSSPKYLHDT